MKKVILGIVYWIIQLTWGSLMTLAGVFVTLFCLIFLKGKIHKNGYGFITEVGGNWGGVSLGAFALCGPYGQEKSEFYDFFWYQETRMHEFGHSVQNMIFGPLFLFIVMIPSMTRYWLARYNRLKSDYYSIWFERTATLWGTDWVYWIEE